MAAGEISVFLLHNTISPYRNSVFETLDERFELNVFFAAESRPNRSWDTTLSGFTFDYEILPHLQLFGIIINYTLIKHFFRQSYDIYVGTETTQVAPSTFLTVLAAKIRGKPFVLWTEYVEFDTSYNRRPASVHSNNLPAILRRFLKGVYISLIHCYQLILFRYSDAFIAYSAPAKRYLVSQGVKPENIYTGGQIMPESGLEPPPDTTTDTTNESLVVLYLGYLRPEKGVDILIQAFRAVKHDCAKLVIAGKGPEHDYLQSMAADDNRIEFHGYVSERAKAQYYSMADVFVLPTLHDPWGLVVNEAIYYGLPVIVTDAAGCAHHLVNGNGAVVEAGNSNALADELEHILNNTNRREEMGRQSKALFEERNTLEEACRPFFEAIDAVSESNAS